MKELILIKSSKSHKIYVINLNVYWTQYSFEIRHNNIYTMVNIKYCQNIFKKSLKLPLL